MSGMTGSRAAWTVETSASRPTWFMPSLPRLLGPVFGAVVVAGASRSDRLYRFLVREDALLEWTQVVAYLSIVAIAIVAVPRLWRCGERLSAAVVIGLAVASLVITGEELSWGQRLIGFETPGIAAGNVQGELTLHNDERLEESTRLALLGVGAYGLLAPLLARRRTPLVPSRALASFFAVVVVYYTVRLLFLEAPTYVQAKYSEWPETCLALALALWCADVSSARRGSVSRSQT